MKQKFLLKLGAFAFLGAMGLNLQYAWADYGITERPLHVEVLAQSNESGDESGDESGGCGGTTGTGIYWKKCDSDCTIRVEGVANTDGTILGIKVHFDADGVGSLTVEDAATSCEANGTFQCKSMTCGEFWLQSGIGT